MPVTHSGLYVRRSLFLADVDPRRGTEAGKLRPVLVIQTDLLNDAGHPSTWVLPCTARLVGESLLRVFLPKGLAGAIRVSSRSTARRVGF